MQVLLVLYEQHWTLNIIYLHDSHLYVVIVIIVVFLFRVYEPNRPRNWTGKNGIIKNTENDKHNTKIV